MSVNIDNKSFLCYNTLVHVTAAFWVVPLPYFSLFGNITVTIHSFTKTYVLSTSTDGGCSKNVVADEGNSYDGIGIFSTPNQ